MDDLIIEPEISGEIKWDTLTHALHYNRCVLFLGPFLPLYQVGNNKVDFSSFAALHLSEELTHKGFEFDQSQSQNLSYIAQKFISLNNNYRPQLEDEISRLYSNAVLKSAESNGVMPALYKTILMLPWHTIVNMQPDSFFEKALKPNDVFSYYNYKSKDTELKLDEDQLLVYNLFGAIIAGKNRYKTDSIILTEDDQVEFVRNLVSGNPHVPDAVISRFDNDKIYIFLDCNLENWYFRLVMEVLKIHKESHSFSPKPNTQRFTTPTVEFFKKRYGFVFINNNSEEFINTFKDKYNKEYSQPGIDHPPKKIFIAYEDSSEAFASSLVEQFEPWIEKKELFIWSRANLIPGEPVQKEWQAFNEADAIILLVNARFLGEPFISLYLRRAVEEKNNKKVFAIIEKACPWDESPVKDLNMQYVLPQNRIPIKLQQLQEPDRIVYEVVKSITSSLWA
jgi:hypothetical protein